MNSVVKEIKDTANRIYLKVLKNKKPELKTPLRSLQNVKYDPKHGFFELIGKTKIRTLTVNTVKTFAQTLKISNQPQFFFFLSVGAKSLLYRRLSLLLIVLIISLCNYYFKVPEY